MTRMSHPSSTEWVDFVRGVAAPDVAAAMRAHLAGCDACAGEERRWRLVAAEARDDLALEPPAHLIQFARAAFSLQRPARLFSLPALAARLVFNSVDAAGQAGTRGLAGEVSRQTLFEAGDFSVHLRLEQPAKATRVSLVGQIANRRAPTPPLAHVPVLLTRGRAVVARSLSNEFGEFQVEYEPQASLHLHIPLADGRQRIRLALADLHGGLVTAPRRPRRRSSRRS